MQREYTVCLGEEHIAMTPVEAGIVLGEVTQKTGQSYSAESAKAHTVVGPEEANSADGTDPSAGVAVSLLVEA